MSNKDLYQLIVEKYMNDKTDVHIEITKLCDYKYAIDQIIAYNEADPRKELHIYLFDDKNKKQLLIAAEYLKSLDIYYEN
jgi:hypothetical protein